MVIWHDSLFAVNIVSKPLQSKDMQTDIAINQLKALLVFLKRYTENGFATTLISAKVIAVQMNIEPVLRKEKNNSQKKHFEENDTNEITHLLDDFKFNYFTSVINQAISFLRVDLNDSKYMKTLLVFYMIYKSSSFQTIIN